MKKVLVVDDAEQVRRTVAALFEVAGFSVRTAANGEEAVASDLPVDVIVTDLEMPGLSGAALVRELLRLRPRAKIVVMSGGGLSAEVLDGLRRAGMSRFLEKPFGLEDIRELAGDLSESAA